MDIAASRPAQAWADQLAAWEIPDRIRRAVADSPWTLPVDVFVRRAHDSLTAPSGVSFARANEALASPGTVLDVGCGAGAASLPHASRTRSLVAVDTFETMLAALRDRAETLGLPVSTVLGRWPDIADEVAPADLVVCHHVLYNAPDLADFAVALTTHARRRVVVEITAVHPLHALNPLWERLHGLRRPDGPTAEDAIAVLAEAGISARAQRWQRPRRHEYAAMADLVAATRRRLCLPPARDDELARALIELGVDPAHPRDLAVAGDDVVTLWWDGSATAIPAG